MLATDRSHAVAHQVVYTYWPDGAAWYQGVLTGHGDDDGAFVLKHVIAIKRGVIIPMLRAGLREAKTLGYGSVKFGIPDAYPLARGLSLAAVRVGCHVTRHEGGWTWWEHNLGE